MAKIITNLGNTGDIDRTSQLINDGEDNTSRFVEESELGDVAFSNDYNDLNNLPSIPTQYTDEQSQDAIGNILLDTSTIDFNYDDLTPNISASVKSNSITAAELSDSINISEFINDSGFINHADLTYTATPTNGVVSSDVGTDTIIPLATITNSGLFSSIEKINLSNQSGVNTGDNASNTTSNAYADSKVIDSIADADTTHAPSRNAVYDALLLKEANITASGNVTDFWSGIKTFRDLATDVRNVILTGFNSAITWARVTTSTTLQNAISLLQKQSNYLQNTRFISGNGITVNADTTKFDIQVVGEIVDPITFVPTSINVNTTGILATYRTTQAESFVWVDSAGTVIQSLVPPDTIQLDSIIGYWVLIHSNLSTINVINSFPYYADGVGTKLNQLLYFLGFSKFKNTNIVSPGTTGTRVTHTGGNVLRSGIGNTTKRPVLSLIGAVDSTFRMRNRNDVEGADTQTLDVLNIDVGGVTTALANNNRFGACKVWKFSSGLIRIQRGQYSYPNYDDASIGIIRDSYVDSPNGLRNGIHIGWIIFRRNTSWGTGGTGTNGIDYSFRDVTSTGVTGSVTPTLQTSYNISLIPQIETTSGALTLKEGGANNTIKTLAIQNLAGTETASIDGNGIITSPNITTIPTWNVGTYDTNKVVKYLKDGVYYTFASQIDSNISEPQLVKSTQPWTAITGTLIGVWNSGTAYVNSNIVTYNGYFYQCITANTNQNPELLTPPYWIKLGYDAGVWSGASTYHTYNVVRVGTAVYRSNLFDNTYAIATIKNHYWDEIKPNSVKVNAWGDSLTFGSGASLNASYPTILSLISGLNVTNFGVPGETSTQIKNRFLARRDLFKDPTIIWAGRNNYASTATVLADIDTMVYALTSSGNNNYLVLGIIRATSNGSTDLDALNGALKTAYGSRFIDVQDYLVEKYNPSIPQDVIDYVNKNIPFSLRSDWLHLNDDGYAYVATLINNNKSFLLGNSDNTSNTVTAKGLFATGNKLPLERNKRVEIVYDDATDQGVIQSYDRLLNITKPTSVGFTIGSEVRLVENGGVLKVGDLTDYSSGAMKQWAMTSTVPRTIQEIPSVNTNFVAKGLSTGLNGASQIFDNGTNVIIGGTTPETTWKFQVEGVAAIGAVSGNSRLYVSAGTGYTTLQSRDLTTAMQMRYSASNHNFDTNVGIGIVNTSVATAKVHIAASTTTAAAMRLTPGSAPTTPNDGDIWLESNTNTGLKIRIAGVTKTISLV